MQNKSITIEPRNEYGKNANRRLRKTGFIPAILYSHGESESIKVPKKDFMNLFEGPVSESVIFDLAKKNSKEDTELMAFVKSYQTDPVTDDIIHVDLFKVTKGEKIHTHVPLKFIGTAKGLKLGGVLEISERSIEIECLPRDLPENIIIDITELEIGDSIHVRDLNIDKNITIMSNIDTNLVAVQLMKIAAVEEEVEDEVVEGEADEQTEDEASVTSEK